MMQSAVHYAIYPERGPQEEENEQYEEAETNKGRTRPPPNSPRNNIRSRELHV